MYVLVVYREAPVEVHRFVVEVLRMQYLDQYLH